jgi:uncharacterized protein (DUF952 family)
MASPSTRIYKVLRLSEWADAQARGVFSGSADDLRDGFIHFSTAEQLDATIARHFAGEREVVVLEVDTAPLGDALKWEPSRGGALFPHLYRDLPLAAVIRTVTPGAL